MAIRPGQRADRARDRADRDDRAREERRREIDLLQFLLDRVDVKAGVLLSVDGVVFSAALTGAVAAVSGVLALPPWLPAVLAVTMLLLLVSMAFAALATMPRRGQAWRWLDRLLAAMLVPLSRPVPLSRVWLDARRQAAPSLSNPLRHARARTLGDVLSSFDDESRDLREAEQIRWLSTAVHVKHGRLQVSGVALMAALVVPFVAVTAAAALV